MTVRKIYALAAFAAALSAASCVPEGPGGEGNADSFVATAGTIPGSAEGEPFLWQPGDEMALFLGDDSRKKESAIYRTSIKKPAAQASFSGVGKDEPALSDGKYLAVFPASAAASWASQGWDSFRIEPSRLAFSRTEYCSSLFPSSTDAHSPLLLFKTTTDCTRMIRETQYPIWSIFAFLMHFCYRMSFLLNPRCRNAPQTDPAGSVWRNSNPGTARSPSPSGCGTVLPFPRLQSGKRYPAPGPAR